MSTNLPRLRITVELLDIDPLHRDLSFEVKCADTGRCPIQAAYLTKGSPRISCDVDSAATVVGIGIIPRY
jgi:hypothetical protein